ncbi:hypothetical protein QBK99_25495 [Corticibacterium sp. UT-5YL-CI-8]|nr:hypothetical protein [Tianweitania sp. UT-5YL-CI-8]
MSKYFFAFVWQDGGDDVSDGVAEVVAVTLGSVSQEVLQLGKELLD